MKAMQRWSGFCVLQAAYHCWTPGQGRPSLCSKAVGGGRIRMKTHKIVQNIVLSL